MTTDGEDFSLAPIEELLVELRGGRPVIVVDDEDRENEGDLIIPAEKATEEVLAFTIRHTGGVVCLAMTNERADRLDLPPMVSKNTSPLQTAYTVSIEARSGVTTGISAKDRATTIRVAASDGVTAADLRRPGHVFPLRAKDGGVLERKGHTEAAVDLCRLAGLVPLGAISELMHDDGSMMRLSAILQFARQHGLKVGSIEDLIAYRLQKEPPVRRVIETKLPTRHGCFDIQGFSSRDDGSEHIVMSLGDIADGRPILTRLHSECLTGDTLGSLRCDCGPQREAALARIASEGRGALLYLRQEGRGIGLLNKLRAYALQDIGVDTVEANTRLGFEPDARNYSVAAQILRLLGVRELRLMTNNPGKIDAMESHGFKVIERIPLQVGDNPHNRAYLATKVEKLGHLLALSGE